MVQDTGRQERGRKKIRISIIDLRPLLKLSMANIQGANLGEQDNDDEAMLFCKSLAPSLRRLSPESFAFTKLRFQEFLIGLEYPNLILNSDN